MGEEMIRNLVLAPLRPAVRGLTQSLGPGVGVGNALVDDMNLLHYVETYDVDSALRY